LFRDKATQKVEANNEKKPLTLKKVEQNIKPDDLLENMKCEDFDPDIHFGV